MGTKQRIFNLRALKRSPKNFIELNL